MRAATVRAIWSISVSPASRDNRAANAGAWDCGVLVILPSQYVKLYGDVYWHCIGFVD
jgi:hypothetical protein